VQYRWMDVVDECFVEMSDRQTAILHANERSVLLAEPSVSRYIASRPVTYRAGPGRACCSVAECQPAPCKAPPWVVDWSPPPGVTHSDYMKRPENLMPRTGFVIRLGVT